jgi:hypothetical protein
MFELQQLREKIEQQDYQSALQIINDLEEMSVEDKLNKIESYILILLLHLIKQQSENRTTSSWNRSIANSLRGIKKTNQRRKTGGYYATPELIKSLLQENLQDALEEASYEAFEGKFTSQELSQKIDAQLILERAFELIDNNR